MNTAAWVSLAFLTGVFVGITWRESYEILIGRHQPMLILKRALNIRVEALAAALIVSLLLNMLVGVGIVLNERGQDRDAACQVQFNRLTAEARDARIKPTETSTAAQVEDVQQELTYQRGLLRAITTDGQTIEDLASVIRARIEAGEKYLATLEEIQEVRVKNEYPPADFCTNRTAP